MKIQYEYEILSYAASMSTRMTDHNLIFSENRLYEELDSNIDNYIEKLCAKGFLIKKSERTIIISNKWISYFIDEINRAFDDNKLYIKCKYDIINKAIDFDINGIIKKYNIIFNKKEKLNSTSKDSIYMYRIDEYSDEIFWLDLLNDRNLLYLFYKYLLNEVAFIGKHQYKLIDNLEGLSSSEISEIYHSSIKEYFINRDFKEIELDELEIKQITKVVEDVEIVYYALQKNEEVICIVKKVDKILIFGLKNSNIYYSNFIKSEIKDLKDKLNKKISMHRKLKIYKDDKKFDNAINLLTKISIVLSPATFIFSLLKINVEEVKMIIYIRNLLVIGSFVVLVCIVIYILIPLYKSFTFSWKIK